MAITRMQQPRQMYGLGSFVKKAVRKVTKPFTKVAKKIVPKEIAGIMRVAAPFLPSGYREAAYLLGTAKQTGRISPIDLALAAAPTIGKMQTSTGQTVGQRLGALNVPFTDRSLGDVLVGTTKVAEGADPGIIQTSGIFGKGGEMFQLGKGVLPGTGAKQSFGVLDTKAGKFLLGGEDGGFSKAKLAGVGVGTLSLIQNAKTADEAGKALAESTGNSDDYERGRLLFSQLTPELFAIPEKFRMNVQDGGLMRTNYAIGSEDPKPVNPFGPKPTGPVLPEEDKPFKPKPLKPIKMAGSDRYQKILEEIINEMEGILGRELTDAEYDLAGQLAFDKFNSPKDLAVGGRVDYALGTRPTEQETGLGGLPIEADMRYTGGFMPYGAKEKADDVPARLSKNEFVFTADAVRAAGGGSVNEGAKKMYQTMKKLEAKPEAKGMTA